jgi:hypothetical protein
MSQLPAVCALAIFSALLGVACLRHWIGAVIPPLVIAAMAASLALRGRDIGDFRKRIDEPQMWAGRR